MCHSPSHGLLTPSSSPTIPLEETFFFFSWAFFTNNQSIAHSQQSPYWAVIFWTTIHLIWSPQGQISDNLRWCLYSRACWNHLSLPIIHFNPDYLPCLLLPVETIIKALAHCPPSLPILPANLCLVQCGSSWFDMLPSFNQWNYFFFQWQSFSWSAGILDIHLSINSLYFIIWAIYHSW